MPRPVPVPVRETIFRLWEQGQDPRSIAASLGVPLATVRGLLARFRRRGIEAIAPDYHHRLVDEDALPDALRLALGLRRDHPTWGAGMIRLHLFQVAAGQPVPSERSLQRWFAKFDLSPAPVGRRPKIDLARAVIAPRDLANGRQGTYKLKKPS